MNHITFPNEIAPIMKSILDELGIAHDSRIYSQLDLIKTNPFLPSYADALNELDYWHDINMWSNAPCVVLSPTHNTRDIIKIIDDDYDIHIYMIDWLCGQEPDEYVAERMRNTLENGPTKEFIQIMQDLRQQFRLDGDFAQNRV